MTRGGAALPADRAAGLFLTAAVLLVAGLARGGASPSPAPARGGGERAADLPAAPKSAIAIGTPVPLKRHAQETTWAAVRRDVVARRLPSASTRAVGTLRADTPEATTNIVPLLARRRAPTASCGSVSGFRRCPTGPPAGYRAARSAPTARRART